MICRVDGPLWLTVAIVMRVAERWWAPGEPPRWSSSPGPADPDWVSRQATGRDGGSVQGLCTKIRGSRAGIAGGASN